MSSWMNAESAAVQNNGFNHLDPSAGGAVLDPSYLNNNASFDPSQFQNQQLQQRMANGGMGNRNGSPAFNSPVYQTNPVIPSKRPRPREDSISSPRQPPGMLPNSRSQTPQQGAYPGFQPNAPPQQSHPSQQTPYSHLQNGSANASPSPIMGNQLRPGSVPQRVSTASPHPFSPAGQQFTQASPSQLEHGGRVDTPQHNPQFAQNPAFNQGFAQNFTPPPGRSSAPPQNVMGTPQMQQHMAQPQMFAQQGQPGQQQQQRPPPNDQQKMLYQMRLMQQQQSMAAAQQRGNMQQNPNAMQKPVMGTPNGQYPGGRPQQPGQPQPQPQARPPMTPESFMKNLANFMASKNLPLDQNPTVGNRQLPLATLYMATVKFGGYKKVTAANGWPQVAQMLQFSPEQVQLGAAQQLKSIYERNLFQFEEAWAVQSRMMQQQQMQNRQMGGPGQAMSPTKQMSQAAMQQNMIQQQQQQQLAAQQMHMQPQTTPVKQMGPMQQPAINGFSTPTPPQGQHPMGSQSHPRNGLAQPMNATPPQIGAGYPVPSPISGTKPIGVPAASPQVDAPVAAAPPPQDYNLPDLLDPKVRVLDTYGGVELESLIKLGQNLSREKPDIPRVEELGTIDIHALTMSIASGIHAEVRLALDTLASLSVDQRLQIDLRACEDLVETLVECAEDQVELLAENAAEVSDVMLINSYEDVVRSCRSENDLLQSIPDFGSPEYELDRAVDKLICVTTILRNFSFYEPNHSLLADDLVIKFLCTVIKYLGTLNMLLRTSQNTLDFMKDIIIFLSNLSQNIELPGRKQALCLIHFLLAFAPCPPPNILDPKSGSTMVAFSSYDPAIHRYLPSAVDSLAKLLARDEPNRTLYKAIFTSDTTSSPPFDLLTRTFALAISGIPDDKLDTKRGNLVPAVDARKPFLMQGMLAAEILANLAPGYMTGVAKSWLTSEDGFSRNLMRLIFSLCLEQTPPNAQHRAGAQPKGPDDADALQITISGITVLRRLAEKSRDPEDPKSSVPIFGLPSKERLLGALNLPHPKLQTALKELCAYAGLGK